MTITLNGTTGITTPDVNVTAQSSNIVTTGNITAVDATLSGGVYVGGTAAANKLSDYEEGTWSTTFQSPVNLSGTGALDQANYTKVGRLVTVSGRITGYSVSSTNTMTYPVIHLPFPMLANVTALSGSAISTTSGTWAVASAVDNSSGDSTGVAIIFPPSLITATGATTIWFSLTYSSAL